MRRILPLCALLLSLLVTADAVAQARQPLLMEGKQTLFQRVLTRPGAALLDKPGGQQVSALPPLSIFYVYGRQGEHIEVGSNSAGRIAGWVKAEQAIDWKQSLVLTFANPAGRDRALFFAGEDAMLDMVEADDLAQQLAVIRRDIEAKGESSSEKIVAVEPKEFVDIRQQFYLLPILQARETALASGFRVKSVEVASVTAKPEQAQPQMSQRANEGLKDFSAALVFVIDASTSMGPYIDEARAAVAQIYDRIQAAGLADKMRFGLVGYRDDPAAVKGVDYLSRIFVDPAKVRDGEAFLKLAAGLEASKVSTRTVEEDGFAGLVDAVDEVDWSPYGGRYIVMITDASSRGANHRFSSTGLGPEQVREKALEKFIATYVVHLKTPEGAKDHAAAEAQYRALSTYPNVGELYYPVEAGTVTSFRQNVDVLADAIVNQVEQAEKGKFAATNDVKAGDPAADIKAKTAALGYAMQLVYLGRESGTQAPDLLRAWTIDRDLKDPSKTALQVRLLMTKNQLSDLQAALRQIVDVGIATEISRDKFFDQLKSAAAVLSRDPTQIGRTGQTNLGELGLMGEYLEDLPYRSRVLALSEEMWNRWSIGEQVAFLDDLGAKIRLYQSFHDDVANWVALDEGASPGDAVYPVPLSALP
ncbi:MAG: VWA domain-containing protein [Alphaproteobacteria bacterium]|nr:VWA domain-containing protein [Alphaproteobacteria bacterium]MBU0797754.1 VWA domain-containing protein [Alphaproteobacteria bacterium]MBU0886981.1 VWA domain-containing protein [Alphaproteobacteria bacterium]MBU1813163.1 VWA domain-containing protein [Alphaproteobacteria bacterium]